jgi:hypothetical protein
MRWFGIRVAVAVLLVAAYFLLEVGARLYVAHGLGIADRDYSRFYRSNPNLALVAWAVKYERHPYLGYLLPAKAGDLALLRRQHDPDDYVIAILGGSVADQFGRYIGQHPQTLEALRPLIPAIGNRRIRLFVFAAGGYKQPQQFILASYLLEDLDLTINIDGFNEIAVTDLYPAYPTDFPANTLIFFRHDDAPRIYPILAGMARFAYRGLNGLPLKIPLLSRSSIYFLIWQGIHPLLYEGIGGLENRYLTAIGARAALGDEQMQVASWQRKIEIWKKYTRLQNELEKRAGVTAYFFLQPNQYLRGSKPLSAEERATSINPEFADRGDAEMKLLRAAAQDMRAHGLAVVDLTGIYRDIEPTVYRDACCHLNELGNQIMAEGILSALRQAAGQERIVKPGGQAPQPPQ